MISEYYFAEAARLQALEEVKKQQKEEAEMAVERTKLENEVLFVFSFYSCR